MQPSNHSRRIPFFVVNAYGENLKRIRPVVWNQLLACSAKVETQRCGVPRGAAFSLNLPYTVATSKLANSLTVHVKSTRRNAYSHLGTPTAVQSSPRSQVISIMLYNCALSLVSIIEAQLSLHCCDPQAITQRHRLHNRVRQEYSTSGVSVSLACLQILPTMPYDVRLNNFEFQHTQRSVAADEQIFHHRGATQ